ncbi:hypothetical protein [Sphingobium terrigena]|jgi:hypothetical protein|uniref:hypothetical protein n=1 Tax=Sphingobium terrigena TaxID=2304063 RepID=UPI0016033A0D|nr:hypothetical protein [Sphingobium terrigena]
MSGNERRADPVPATLLQASPHLPTIPWTIGFLPLLYLGQPSSVLPTLADAGDPR